MGEALIRSAHTGKDITTPEEDCFWINDGEGYSIIIRVISTQEELDRLAVPYTADYAEEKREDAAWR